MNLDSRTNVSGSDPESSWRILVQKDDVNPGKIVEIFDFWTYLEERIIDGIRWFMPACSLHFTIGLAMPNDSKLTYWLGDGNLPNWRGA